MTAPVKEFPVPRSRGRPRKPDNQLLHSFTMRLTFDDAAKLRMLGRVWLVRQLARAKVPQ